MPVFPQKGQSYVPVYFPFHNVERLQSEHTIKVLSMLIEIPPATCSVSCSFNSFFCSSTVYSSCFFAADEVVRNGNFRSHIPKGAKRSAMGAFLDPIVISDKGIAAFRALRGNAVLTRSPQYLFRFLFGQYFFLFVHGSILLAGILRDNGGYR